MKRRELTVAGLGLAGAAAGLGGAALWAGVVPGTASAAPPFGPRGGEHRFSLRLDPAGRPRPVNRRVLGSNVQWVDNGDDLLDEQGRFRPEMLALVQQMAPTGLRYPGGMQSDTYRWERGIGPLARRGANEHAHNRVMQPTRMGTLELLELCEACGAEPLFTVNLVTGSADEAARWVRAVNVEGLISRRSGKRLPPVRRWELGNEPYLKPDERPDLVLQPDEFARRAEAAARAMRAVDPSLRLGLPVVSDRRNGIPTTPFPGFTRSVLARVGGLVDWLAVHNAYMPFSGRPAPPAALYWATMAGAPAVADDLRLLRGELGALRPGLPALPLAITEYNALFTLGQGASDQWITSPAAALYLADLGRVLALADLEMAHHWSLSGNWLFGAVHSDGHARPAHAALALLGEALHGEALPLQAEVTTTRVAKLGLVPEQAALPLVEALLCRDGAALRLLLIHKDPLRTAIGQLDLRSFGARAPARLSRLDASDLLATGDTSGLMRRTEETLAAPPAGSALALRLPPGSISLLQWGRVA